MERDDLPNWLKACPPALTEDKRFNWLANRWVIPYINQIGSGRNVECRTVKL
jgi:hypothetical protein